MDVASLDPLVAHRRTAVIVDGDAARLAWAEDALQHSFREPALLRRALTHPSVGAAGNYQRLEFLGDRILAALIAAWLFEEFDDSEGALTARFHMLVEGPACARVAIETGVPAQMIIDRASGASGLARSENVLGDITEALIAAIWLDGGWPAAEAFVRRAWRPLVDKVAAPEEHPKSKLQRWAQQHGLPIPEYTVLRREGPHHAPSFVVEVQVRGQPTALADGPSKQEAEKAAARALLKELET